MKLLLTGLIALLCVSGQVDASFNDDLIEVGAIETRVAGIKGLEPKGVQVIGRKHVGQWFGFVQLSHQQDTFSEVTFYEHMAESSPTEQDLYLFDVDLNRYGLGAGRTFLLSDETGIELSAMFGHLVLKLSEQDIAGRSQTNIVNLNLLLRHFITEQLELNIGLSYEHFSNDFADNSLVYRVGTQYNFANSWHVGAYFRNVSSAGFSRNALSVSGNNNPDDYYRDLALMVGYRF